MTRRSVFITGGGTGLGTAVARRLAARGRSIAVAASRRSVSPRRSRGLVLRREPAKGPPGPHFVSEEPLLKPYAVGGR